ncbi:allantoicase [Modestobacter marinus]|uniref:Probable allantoicase n=1 Tax=Modestobacter marinus TaxID=477641 RepID=A0A846LJ22_9ACTN|nr:allantoicase [Modestobacter marinus]NIH66574.1 allantoicase [Modestobacter marinus]GGL64845.1 putative allantoicase [Modestobacter marinus]
MTGPAAPEPAFLALPDLARRDLGGAVVAANDEFFAARENLVLPHPAVPRTEFGHKGKEYDGWETRRRRSPGHDWAIVRLGAPGVVAGVVVDTAFFTGNYPSQASLEGAAVEGHPSVEELARADWQPLLPLVDLAGDTANAFAVDSDRRYTHVRLAIHPDGGVARLRVHGTVVVDPRLVDAGPFDLAALENGGRVTGVSNAHYGSPHQLIGQGTARSMGEGWENARRRGPGNDWVDVELACEGVVTLAELDTSWFLGNAPGKASLTGRTADGAEVVLLPRTRLQPDTRHRFVLDGDAGVSSVRLDVFPDGGMARLRLWGRPTTAGRAALGRRWFDALPDVPALEVLGSLGVEPAEAGRVVGGRPLSGDLPPAVRGLVDGLA